MQTTNDPKEQGVDPEGLERLFACIERMIERGELLGGSFLLARGGTVVAARGVGKRGDGKDARADDVYTIFSTTKPLVATTLLQRIERGEVRLTDAVADHIPEFEAHGKKRVRVVDLLRHTGGFPNPPPDWTPDRWSDWDTTIARLCAMPLDWQPGSQVHYHALTAHWIIAEIVRRADGGTRSIRDILASDLFEPLGMKDTSLGHREDLASRRVPIKALDRGGVPFPMEFLEIFNSPELARAQVPGGGGWSTVFDLARFYQAWIDGGELDGKRILSPATIALALENHTGDMPDRLADAFRIPRGWPEWPAHFSLGFFLRGWGVHPTYFGTLSSPGTFGHPGASSIMAWGDPERNIVFVALCSGLIFEDRHILRVQTLSDLAQAAVVED